MLDYKKLQRSKNFEKFAFFQVHGFGQKTKISSFLALRKWGTKKCFCDI